MPQLLELVVDGGRAPEAEPEAAFEDFWLMYPRRVAKKDARKAWEQLDGSMRVAVLVALVNWRRVWRDEAERREDFDDHLPYPATWLRGERWDDELPTRYKTAPAASHMPVKQTERGEAVAMPDYVKALLAKLKAGKS